MPPAATSGRVFAVSRLQRHGNSFLVPIAAPIRHRFNLLPGDYVRVEFIEEGPYILVQKLNDPTADGVMRRAVALRSERGMP